MAPLIDIVLSTMRFRRNRRELGFCAVCGDTVQDKHPVSRLRGGELVHRDCATYRIRETRRREPLRRGPAAAR
jgi:hypothetical protein